MDPVCRRVALQGAPIPGSDLATGQEVMAVTCLCQLCLSGMASSVLCPRTRPVSWVGASFLMLEGITTPAGTNNQNCPVQWYLRIRNIFTLFTRGLNTWNSLQKTKESAGVPGQPQLPSSVVLEGSFPASCPSPCTGDHYPCPLHSPRPVKLTRHFTHQHLWCLSFI